jgi:hypothetical protein
MQKLLCPSQTNSKDEMSAMQYKGGQFIYVALRGLRSPVLPRVTVRSYEHSVCFCVKFGI